MYYQKKMLIKKVDGGYIVTKEWTGPEEEALVRENSGGMLQVVLEYFSPVPPPEDCEGEAVSDDDENTE